MFGQVNADFYILVDGDDTYSSEHVHQLIEPLRDGRADMVVATRLDEYGDDSIPTLHVLGNSLVRSAINWIFSSCLTDIFSGYRAFNQRVIRQVPIISSGFEVETEMTIQSLYYRMKIVEISVPYKRRPAGSKSKLRTFHDGFRVVWHLFKLFCSFKPLSFFGLTGLILLTTGILAGWAPVKDYLLYREVYHVPLAILASGLVILAVGSIFLGILLHVLNWRFRELHNILTRGTYHSSN
jgi:hypothetical protein